MGLNRFAREFAIIRIGDSILEEHANLLAEVISHECGHTYTLMHLRYGTKYNDPQCTERGELYDTISCTPITYAGLTQYVEYADNTRTDSRTGLPNGVACGDFCMDTPASPSNFAGHPTDEYGESYQYSSNVMKWIYQSGIDPGSDAMLYTNDQRKIVTQTIKGKTFDRLFPKTISIPTTTLYYGDTITASLQDSNPFDSFCTAKWYITNNSGVVSINESTGVIIVNGIGSGTETITMRVFSPIFPTNNITGYWDVTKNITVVGSPTPPTIGPFHYELDNSEVEPPLQSYNEYYTTMTTAIPTSYYAWSLTSPSNSVETGLNQTFYFTPTEDCTYRLIARYNANRMFSVPDTLYFEVQHLLMLSIAPNPISNGTCTISLSSTTKETLDYNEGWDLEIVDIGYGKRVKEKVKEKEYKLKTYGWEAGTYIIIAKYKGHQITGKLKVE